MSHVHEGPLATYNSLTDRNLSGYFGNTRMRRHLRKAGLINRRGEIVSENQYRVNMARKEHKKHVKELLAQAIVHKTLDLERYRQVEIKRKLEEIAKIELVRRVRYEERGMYSDLEYRDGKADKKHRQDACIMPLLAPKPPRKPRSIDRSVVPSNISQDWVDLERSEMKDNLRPSSVMKDSASRGRKGDEEVLPYLTPRSMSRPQSERPSESSSVHRRPKSAPAPPRNRPSSSRGFVDPYEDVIYVDDDGRPVSPPPSDRASSKDLKTEGIDSRHLYALDSEALQQYAMKLSKSERGRDGATSPYLISQYPVPPRSERVKSARSPRRSARMSARPEHQQKEKKVGVRTADQIPPYEKRDPNTVEGTLMLHRQEPAMMHQGEVQTLCEITMKYHGPNLTLPRDQHDPTQEVAIEQQHCGGNTLPVFKERLQPGKTFSFISRRHRGYPFSLTLYIDGRVDCRISTCCEYKHGVGVRLGGKMGHFSLTRITGATPCYKCKLCCQAPPRSLKLKKNSVKKKRTPEPQEEVTVDNTPRSPVVPTKMEEQEVNGKSDDEEDHESEKNIVISVEDENDQSKTENSYKEKKIKDKFVPHDRENAKTGLSPLKDSPEEKENKVEVEGNSDNGNEQDDEYQDDFEEDKDSQGDPDQDTNLTNKSEKADTQNLDINGYDQTEIPTEKRSRNDTDHENDKSKKDVDYQDTDYEIEEDIFNDQSEKSKANDVPLMKQNSIHRQESDNKVDSVAEEVHTDKEEDNKASESAKSEELVEEVCPSITETGDQDKTDSHREVMPLENTTEGDREINTDVELYMDSKKSSEKSNGIGEYGELDVTEIKTNGKEKDNYEDDFEDEVGVSIPVDIKSARDIEMLNQVNNLGKRVVLETSEGAADTITAVIEYNDDSDEVLVKKFRPVEGIDVDGILMDAIQMPGIAEALKEDSDYGEEETDNFSTDYEAHAFKPKKKKGLQRSASSVSSMSVSSCSRDSSRSVAHSAPDFLENYTVQDKLNHHTMRPKTTWGHSSTSQVKTVPSLRPVSSKKAVPKQEKYDMEYLRAKFYPPPHNCLDKPALGKRYPSQRKRPEKQRAEASQFKGRRNKPEYNYSVESNLETLAKSENFIETLISGVSDASQSASLEKKPEKRPHKMDCETADEVSDIEPDQPIGPVSRPIEVNININKKKQKPKKKPVETKKVPVKEKVVEEPGVSVAYAKHILKRNDSISKNIKDKVNINIQTPKIPRGRSPSRRRSPSPKRGRSPSPKRAVKSELNAAKKEINDKVEEGKAEIEKLLQESLDAFGLRLQEQQMQFAEQLKLAHEEFAVQLTDAQAALDSHKDSINEDLSVKVQEATELVSGQLKESQSALNQQLELSQKTLVDQLTESQSILANQFKESQNTFGELVSDAQTVIANQLQDSQKIFGEQVQDSQKILSEQLNESQMTLTNQMKDSQEVLTNQMKESQQAIADQVKESQEMIADQLKQSQETIAEQLKMSQTMFANQLMESQTTLSNQLTESQGLLSNQLSDAKQSIVDDLTNAQETISQQVEENQKILSDQLISSQEKIDNQLHETQAQISEQLVDTKKQIDEHMLQSLETIGKQENEARERLQKDSEETHRNIMQQEENAKMRLQKESEESQQRLAAQEEATREKLQKEADETREQLQKEAEESRQTLQNEVKENREILQKEVNENRDKIQKEASEAQEKLQKETDEAQKRFAEQEAKAKEEMEKEREKTQRRLEEQEKNAREVLIQEGVATQRRLAEQEAQAKEQLQKESEETQKRLAEQEQKAKEEMKKESEETAKKLAAQEVLAMETMKKESAETAKRLQEQEKKAREELKKESEESAKKFAEQEQAARDQLKKDSEQTQQRLAEQEEKTKKSLQKESEETAKRLAAQEAAAREGLQKKSEATAKRLSDQEAAARQGLQKESEATAKRLSDQEATARQGLLKEGQESARRLAEQEAKAKEVLQKAQPVQAPPKPQPKNKYEDDFEADEDRRQIIGLQVDEVRENGQTVKIDIKEKEEEETKEGTLPDHRKIEGYSSEDEDLQGGKEPFKVSADVHQTKQRERRSSSSSSSSGSSRSSTPRQKVIEPTSVVVPQSPKKEEQPLKSDRTDITDRSTTSTTSGSLTTATESTLEPRPPSAPKPQRRGKTSSSSSSSSSSSEDTEDEKYKRKKRDKRLKAEAERMKKEMEEKELERKKRQQEEEERKKKEEEERKKRFEEEDRKRREEMSKRDEERKQRELEISQRKEAEDRKREEEHQKRKAEEERMRASYEKQLQLIKLQRESDNNLLSPKKEEPQSSERSVIEVETRTSYASQPPPSKEPEKEQPALSSDTESTTTRTSDTTATTESEGDKEKEKPTVTPMKTITEEKGKPTERRSSTSSTGSSSSSSSEGELKVNDQKKDNEPVKDEIKSVPVTETKQSTDEVKEVVEKPVVTKTEQKALSSDSSSSSGSSSESESDEDNKRVESPKPVVTETKVVQEPETAKTTVTAAPPQTPQQQQPVSNSSEDTTTTETDSESTPRPVVPQEVQKPPSPILEEKKEEPLKGMSAVEPPQSVTMETKPETPKKEETEDSSSDSSSSDSSSDSESESETEDDKKQSASQGKSVSESDGENMHGGNDPENVAGEGTRPESRLAQSSVKPPVPVDGSILPLIKDESSVELNGVKLDDEQVTQLCNYIAEKDAITTVTVRNAGLDDMAFQNVALSLQVTLSTPSLLNFSQNQLSGKAMTHLSPAIKRNTELDILILNGNPVGNVGCKVIVDAILKAKDPFPFLRRASGYLTPSEARAQEAEGKSIDQDEPENKCKVREIDLGDTKISDAGITELSRLLENNKMVESLNLNGNSDISVKGWERFGQALKKNSTLKTLSLDFTNIGDEGLEFLVKGLMINTGVRALELESAGLTEKGGRLLCDLLKANSSILELTANTGNSISESTLNEIRKYLSLNNKS